MEPDRVEVEEGGGEGEGVEVEVGEGVEEEVEAGEQGNRLGWNRITSSPNRRGCPDPARGGK